MGAGYSGPPTPSALSRGVQTAVLNRFSSLQCALCLTDQNLLRLFAVFSEWNVNESGVLYEDEMSEAMGWCGDPLQARFFALLVDSPKGVSFRSFVVRLWSLLAVDSLSLAHLAFMLYDANGNGTLRLPDLRFMVCEVFGTDFAEQDCAMTVLRSLTQRDFSGSSLGTRLTLGAFVDIAKAKPLLLAPVFELQHALQVATLGVDGWEGVASRTTRGLLNGTFTIDRAEFAVNAALGARKGHPRLVVATERHLLPPRTKNPPVRFRIEGLHKGHLKEDELHDVRDFREDVNVPSCFETIVVAHLKNSRAGRRLLALTQSFCIVSRRLACAALVRLGAPAALLAFFDMSAPVAPAPHLDPQAPPAEAPGVVVITAVPVHAPPSAALFDGETAFTITRLRRERRHAIARRSSVPADECARGERE